ncbi:MAG TPA: alpha/beta fold hydrolase [Longimicrobiales bacterium]
MSSPMPDRSTFDPRAFRPAWWLRSAHAQTIGSKFLRPDPHIPLSRERIETPDGDFLDLDFGPTPRDDAPIGLVLHGLEGSARRRYALLTYHALLAAGIRPVGLNFRSCSGEPNRTARFYHSGETGDLGFILGHLAERFPGIPKGVIGFSLGGNVLLKLLGEAPERASEWVQAAVAISVPFDLAEGARRLERSPMGRLYTAYFLRSLRRKIRAKAALLEGRCDLASVLRARTLRAFDDAVTAPLHGFRDAADYYRQSSAVRFLQHIRVPTLLLHAEDDPFLPAHALPHDAVAQNPHLVAAFTPRGGHVGFITGRWPWAPRFWAESEAARFLRVRLGSTASRRPAAGSGRHGGSGA